MPLSKKLKELALDFAESEINDLFAKFKVLADKKNEVTDADIRALIAGTTVENPEGFHFDDLQLTTNDDRTITADVQLVNATARRSAVWQKVKEASKLSLMPLTNSLTSLFSFYLITSRR